VVRLPQENMEFTADISLLNIATIPVQASGPFTSLSYGLDGKRALQMLTRTPGALVDTAKDLGGGAAKQGEAAGKKAGGAVRGAKDALKGVFRP
jgi:hypothetical protein